MVRNLVWSRPSHINEVENYYAPAFFAFGLEMTARVWKDYRYAVLAVGAFKFARLLVGDGGAGSAHFFDEFWRRFYTAQCRSVHAVTSFLSFMYPSPTSLRIAVGRETPKIPQKRSRFALF